MTGPHERSHDSPHDDAHSHGDFDERAATWDDEAKVDRARVMAEVLATAVPS